MINYTTLDLGLVQKLIASLFWSFNPSLSVSSLMDDPGDV